MDIFDQERERIRERIKQIKDDVHDYTRVPRNIVIAAGEPVLSEDAEEFKALMRMAEILDFNMKQNSKWEYVELREKTKLEELDQSMKDKLVSKEHDIVDEVEPTIESHPVEKSMNNDNSAIALTEGSDVVALANPKTESIAEIQNTQDYISSLIGNPAINNGAIPLSPSSLAEEEIPVFEGEILPGELTNKKPNQEEYSNLRFNPTNVIDVDYEEVNENPFSLNKASTSAPTSTNTSSESFTETIPPVQEQQPEPVHTQTPEPTDRQPAEEEVFEVVKTTPWQWIKDHKKQILIALGIGALSITLVVALTQLLPAIMAASQASQVAGLAGEMVKNGALWHGTTAAEQMALHASNTTLGNIISALTGASVNYTNLTGAWTIGGQSLANFAATAATNAAAAASKVSMLTNISTLAGVGGLGALGAGLIAPKKKSVEYKTIKKSIDNLITAAASLSQAEQTKTAQIISNRIIASDRLSDQERNILFKKLQRALKKIKKNNIKVEEPQVVNSFGMDEPNLGELNFDEEPAMSMAM